MSNIELGEFGDTFQRIRSYETQSDPDQYLRNLKQLPLEQRLVRLFSISLISQYAAGRAFSMPDKEKWHVYNHARNMIIRILELTPTSETEIFNQMNRVRKRIHRQYLGSGLDDRDHYSDHIDGMVTVLECWPDFEMMAGTDFSRLEVQDFPLSVENIEMIINAQ